MARAGLDIGLVKQAAMAIADSKGFEALTIAKLASNLGVKAPSLYNHIRNLDMVRDELTQHGWRLALDRTRDAIAGVAERNALEALCSSHRQFAKEHPGVWTAMQTPVAKWSEATQKVTDAYLALVFAVLRGYGITGEMAIHAARAVRAALRGFIDLELGGGYGLPQDVDVSFNKLVKMLDSGLRSRDRKRKKRRATV